MGNRGEPGWHRWLSVWLWLRSWSHRLWVWARHPSLCCRHTWDPIWILSPSLSAPPLPPLSLSKINLFFFNGQKIWKGISLSVIFRVHPCCNMYENLIPFEGWVISHWTYRPHCLFIHPPMDTWIASPFWCELRCCEHEGTNIYPSLCFQFFWVYIPRSGIAG